MKPSDYPLALWPAAASLHAADTDNLIWAFTALTLLLVVPIFIGITVFAIRYREGRVVNRGFTEDRDRVLELGWMIIPFVLTLIFFFWGATAFIHTKNAPANATRVEAIGRQWMWKFQHPGGQSEINDLHVPLGEPILINMISQDVIHALYIPALRIQMETLPGRYTQMWFKADRPGTYRILCSEFCGTDHSVMDGLLTIMQPADYADWLQKQPTAQTLTRAGESLYAAYGCGGCHDGHGTVAAPSLAGLFGQPVHLADGRTLTADTSFLRAKILNPDGDKLAGYKQVMPAYKGRIPEDEMTRLIAFIQTSGPAEPSP